MKELKRNIAIMLALCLVFTGIVPAYADEVTLPEQSLVREETENAEILHTQEAISDTVVSETDKDMNSDKASSDDISYEDETILESTGQATPANADYDEPEEVQDDTGIDVFEEATPANAEYIEEFIREIVVDGIKITLTADPGVFPEDAELWAEKVEDEATEEAIEEAVEKERENDVNVAASYKFDIKMFVNGEEVQPDTEKGSVKVTFTIAEELNECLDVNAYHLKEDADGELTAENLGAEVKTVDEDAEEETTKEAGDNSETVKTVIVDEDEVLSDGTIEDDVTDKVIKIEAETDGFSYYVVEFTYNELQYVLSGDSSVKLSEILETLAIEGTVSETEVSNEELFTVTKDTEGDDWTVTALQAFSSKEWMKVTINGQVFEIIVTDDGAIQPAVVYIDYVNGEPTGKSIPNTTVPEYIVVESGTTSFEDGKWYVVRNNVTVNSRIVNKGTVHLILVDGFTLTVKGGIQNEEGKSLTIYGQSGGTGALTTEGVAASYAGIGGYGQNINGGTLIINGGKVTATGGSEGAGIGAGGIYDLANQGAKGGTITINGGTINAQGGSNGAGIGDGFKGRGSTITINGGTVSATGGKWGAGIGGGYHSTGGTITITGGTINAKGGQNGAGIGAGSMQTNADVTISGGDITAIGAGACSIGGGNSSTQYDCGTLKFPIRPAEIFAGDNEGSPESVEVEKFQNVYFEPNESGGGTHCAPIRLKRPYAHLTYAKANYTVKHLLQTGIGSPEYNLQEEDTETLNGFVNNDTAAVAKGYDGYHEQTIIQQKIQKGGSTVVEIKYDLIYYTIQFDANGHGVAPEAIKAFPGAEISEPTNPFAEGYTFGGWFTDVKCTSQFTFSTMPSEDKTLFAKWTPIPYTITWKDGNTVLRTDKVDYDAMPDYGPDPSKTGYEFLLWWPTIQKVTGDATYNAIFYKPVVKHTVTWMLNDIKLIDTTEVVEGEMPVHENPEREGYIFIGWKPALAPVTGNVKYTAYFEERGTDKVAVTFNTDGGTFINTQVIDRNTTPVKPSDPQKKGYKFEGWYREAGFITPYNFDEPVNTDMILYAKWTELPVTVYTVTWKLDDETLIDTTEVKEGDMPSHSSPAKEGYIFVGWEPTLAPVTSNITYTAKFEKRTSEKAAVTFNTDGGSFIETQVVTKGQKAVRPADPVKTGYSFVNWYADAAFTTAYDFNTAVSADITLFAKWQKNAGKEYTITWKDWNGTVLASSTVVENGLPKYPASSKPSRSGYIFTGWTPEIDLATADQTYTATYVKKSSGGGGGGSGSGGGGGGSAVIAYAEKPAVTPITVAANGSQMIGTAVISIPTAQLAKSGAAPVPGAWSKANGMWTFTKADGNKAKNEWVLITVAGGNASYFYFDSNANMVTGWQQVGGKWMYFNNESGSLLGACLRGPGRTPDGYEIDAAGAWTGR